MKRSLLVLSSLIAIIACLALPGSTAFAQSKHAMSTTSWCYYDVGRPGSSYSCDGAQQNADLGGNLPCAYGNHFGDVQDDIVKDAHGNTVGTLHVYVSEFTWCGSVWGAFDNTEPGTATDVSGASGDHNAQDAFGVSTPIIGHNAWSSIVMDENAGSPCISIWIVGVSGYNYGFSHKAINGGPGC